jgi:hypothetical protein
MIRVLRACPDQALRPAAADHRLNTGGPLPSATPKRLRPTPRLAARSIRGSAPVGRIVARFGPYFSGVDPEYDWYTDRDSDGKVCE